MTPLSKQSSRAPLRRFLDASVTILFVLVPTICASQAIEYISPTPGSTLVSSQSNIIIRTKETLDPSVVSASSLFSVRGSSSGEHSGTTTLSDDFETIVFQPSAAFLPGEVVTVAVNLQKVIERGDANSLLDFTFTISPLSSSEEELLKGKAADVIATADAGVSSSVSNPEYRLAKSQNDSLSADFSNMKIVTDDNPSPGDIFLATFKLDVLPDSVHASLVASHDQYLLILSDDGTPVFSKTTAALDADFKLQSNGDLTYFDNTKSAFFELDTSYAIVDSFACGNGYQTDIHELLILPNGHALLMGLDPQFVDMSKIVTGGYPAATVIGYVVQELDKNKNVVFQWRSFDHFRITDATHEDLLAKTIDYVHGNALDIAGNGNILLSSRHLDEITKIDRQTGNIIWRWGGKNNQFTFFNDPLGFSHQHCIRVSPTGTLMMFDDGDFHTPRISRAVEYSMDEQAKTVTLTWQFRHTPDVYAAAMGSVQRLPNGNTFIGWGTTSPAVTEVRPDGTVAYELQLPDSVISYRAFRFPWKTTSIATDFKSASEIPTLFALAQNYPNPFNPSTKIQFSLPYQSNVLLKVYDLVGRDVATLVDEPRPAGIYTIPFDASRLSSGIYFYRLFAGAHVITRKMTLLR